MVEIMENKEMRQKKDGEDMKKARYADGQSKPIDTNSENIIEEKRDLSQYKEFLNSDALSIYNKLNNSSKRMFWAKYIEYIIYNEDGTYEIKFK